MKRSLRGGLNWAYVTCLTPADSWSHSFSTPYVLPVPFWIYVYGCAATLVITFALLGFFAGMPTANTNTQRRRLNAGRSAAPVKLWGLWLLRTGAAACLVLTIVSGFIGTTDPARNIGMTLFWVVFLLGFAYLTLFVGNLYALINPWELAVAGLERMGLDLTIRRVMFPERLDHWLGFLFYVALIWVELFATPTPLALSIMLLIYSVITFAGTALFGKTAWFCKADIFSIYFRLISKLAPMEYSQGHDEALAQASPGFSRVSYWQVQLRPPFAGALNERPEHISVVLFVLFMLSSTTYDGIHDTALWIGLFWKNSLWLLQPLWGTELDRAQILLLDWYLLYRQAGLVVFPFLYLGLYLLVLLLAKTMTGTAVPLRTLALNFCYSLLPIAVAYHFTHYFTFLIAQGRELPLLLTDPFGFGWNLLGAQHSPEVPSLQMGIVWHTQVAVLLGGHLVSVYLAHIIAMRTFPQHRRVISQLPLLAVMVVYTILGLWILSLPLGAK